jgi:hypothetical protein
MKFTTKLLIAMGISLFGLSASASTLVKCESNGYKYNTCNAGVKIADVKVYIKHSSSSCIYGSSYGFNKRSIWVDDGCRATFEVLSKREYRHGEDLDHDGGYVDKGGNSDLDKTLDTIGTVIDIIDIFDGSDSDCSYAIKRPRRRFRHSRPRLVDVITRTSYSYSAACDKAYRACQRRLRGRQFCEKY